MERNIYADGPGRIHIKGKGEKIISGRHTIEIPNIKMEFGYAKDPRIIVPSISSGGLDTVWLHKFNNEMRKKGAHSFMNYNGEVKVIKIWIDDDTQSVCYNSCFYLMILVHKGALLFHLYGWVCPTNGRLL